MRSIRGFIRTGRPSRSDASTSNLIQFVRIHSRPAVARTIARPAELTLIGRAHRDANRLRCRWVTLASRPYGRRGGGVGRCAGCRYRRPWVQSEPREGRVLTGGEARVEDAEPRRPTPTGDTLRTRQRSCETMQRLWKSEITLWIGYVGGAAAQRAVEWRDVPQAAPSWPPLIPLSGAFLRACRGFKMECGALWGCV